MTHGYRPSLPPPPGQRGGGSTPSRLSFKQSPFYHIQEALTPVQDLTGKSNAGADPFEADKNEEMPQNRHQISYPIVLSENVIQRVRENPSLKIMLYCTATTLLSQYDASDVSFPSQIDLRVNSDEVRHNFKGLKNKPGTTKPVDLTQFLRKTARYQNIMTINYALTSKKYSWVINLVRKSSAEELTEKIRQGRTISKDQVLRESGFIVVTRSTCCYC